MPKLGPVATPTDELNARRNWTGPTLANGVLTEEIAAFCQSGVGIAVASCDADGWPVLSRGRGCRIDAGGRVRVVLRQGTRARRCARQSRPGGRWRRPSRSRAATARSSSRPASAKVRAAEPADRAGSRRAVGGLPDLLIAVAYPTAFATTYCSAGEQPQVAIEFVPEAAFVQTPGPGAGSELDP